MGSTTCSPQKSHPFQLTYISFHMYWAEPHYFKLQSPMSILIHTAEQFLLTKESFAGPDTGWMFKNQGGQSPESSWGSTAISWLCAQSRSSWKTSQKCSPSTTGQEKLHLCSPSGITGGQVSPGNHSFDPWTSQASETPPPRPKSTHPKSCLLCDILAALASGLFISAPFLASALRPIPFSVMGLLRACFQTANKIQNKASWFVSLVQYSPCSSCQSSSPQGRQKFLPNHLPPTY